MLSSGPVNEKNQLVSQNVYTLIFIFIYFNFRQSSIQLELADVNKQLKEIQNELGIKGLDVVYKTSLRNSQSALLTEKHKLEEKLTSPTKLLSMYDVCI